MRAVVTSSDPDAPIRRESDHRASMAQVEAPAHLIFGVVKSGKPIRPMGTRPAPKRAPQMPTGTGTWGAAPNARRSMPRPLWRAAPVPPAWAGLAQTGRAGGAQRFISQPP